MLLPFKNWLLNVLVVSLVEFELIILIVVFLGSTIMCTNNEKNDQFYRKVAFLMYSERVNFRPQSWKEASKLKPHRGLGTRLPSPVIMVT